MILHRPGCDLLDKIVRDVSFIFHSYDIDVQTPLLEMNSIDAEGGIASYIQRNIKQCSYVVVFVTDPIKGNRKILKRLIRIRINLDDLLSFPIPLRFIKIISYLPHKTFK